MITQPNIKIIDDFLETTQVVEDTELQCRVENMTQEQAEDAMMECVIRHFEPTLNSLVGSHIGHYTTQRFELLLDRIRHWISVQLDGSGFRKFNPYARDTIRQNANKRLLRGITIETTGNERIGIAEIIMPKPKLKPCPFCGKEPKVVRLAGSHGYYPERYVVRCQTQNLGGKNTCPCYGSEYSKFLPGERATEEEAIETWNERASICQK